MSNKSNNKGRAYEAAYLATLYEEINLNFNTFS